MGEAMDSEISRIFCEVVERQAFLFADPADAGEFAPGDGNFLVGTIRFDGETPGRLTLLAPEAMAREVAANVLGVGEDDPGVEANYRDALGEILNVLCGHVLTALNGDHAIHDLTVPELSEASAPQAAEMAARPGCLAFAIDDHQALLLAEFDPVDGRG